VDLFEPGSGSQVHDFNGGIPVSGLFWTVPVDEDAIRVTRDARRLVLKAEDVPVIDSFSFGGANQVPAVVSFRVEWRATGPPQQRGKGTTVPPDNEGAFLGDIAVARSTASFDAAEFGFAFTSDPGVSTDRGYAQIGRIRNGSFLT
jgi:hypothetical protein